MSDNRTAVSAGNTGPVTDYLATVGKLLDRRGGVTAAVLVDEVRDHLEESAAQWQRQGHPRKRAEQLAVQHFGSPEVVARQLRRHVDGAATWWTRIGGVFGIAAAGSVLGTSALMFYRDLRPGYRPRLEMLQTGLWLLFLLSPIFIAVLVHRAGAPRRRVSLPGGVALPRRSWIHVLTTVPAGYLALLHDSAILFPSNWWTSGTRSLLLWSFYPANAMYLTGLLVLLRPWSRTRVWGPQYGRVLITGPLIVTLLVSGLAAVNPDLLGAAGAVLGWTADLLGSVGVLALAVPLLWNRSGRMWQTAD